MKSSISITTCSIVNAMLPVGHYMKSAASIITSAYLGEEGHHMRREQLTNQPWPRDPRPFAMPMCLNVHLSTQCFPSSRFSDIQSVPFIGGATSCMSERWISKQTSPRTEV
jgi:hypothetical protein